MRLTTKVALIALIISLIPVIILISFINGYMQNLVLLHNQNILKNSLDMTKTYVSDFLDSETNELLKLAKDENVKNILQHIEDKTTANEQKNNINALIDDIVLSEHDYIYIVDDNGECVFSNFAMYSGLSFAKSEAFVSAISGQKYFGNVFSPSYDQTHFCLTLAVPVSGNFGEHIGTLIRYIPNRELVTFFSSSVVSKTGGIFVIDEAGNLVLSTNEEDYYKTINIANGESDSTIVSLYAQIASDEQINSGFSEFGTKDDTYYCSYALYPENNWVLFSAISQDELELVISNSRILTIIIGILSSIITFLLTFLLVKNLLSPLSKLGTVTKEVLNGNFANRFNYVKSDEIGELASNCNHLIDKLEKSEKELYENKNLFNATLYALDDVAWEYNIETLHFSTTEKWNDLFECDIPETMTDDIIAGFFKNPKDAVIFSETVDKHISGEIPKISAEYQIITPNGKEKWVRVSCYASRNELGVVNYLAGSFSDITEAKNAEAKIERLAYRDAFTELYNKYKIQEIIKDTLCTSPKNTHAYCVININNFKQINELYGHDYGDEIIKWVANSLLQFKDENISIAHYTADEYRLFYKDVKNKQQLLQYFEKIHDYFKNNVYDNEINTISITVNVGISLYTNDAEDIETLTQNSDSALYASKSKGQGVTIFFEPYMYEAQHRKAEIGKILKEAIDKNELMVYYQPIINIKDKKVEGFESLLRLKSEKFGFISPAEFIPIAEETEMINEIGLWCLKEVCNLTRTLKEKGYDFKSIATNISIVQFRDKDFVKNVRKTLLDCDVSPSWIKFELTESVLMHSFEHGINIIDLLKQLGIKFSLDDFGTGYSSLNYLSELPIDTLKIDKSFVDKLFIDKKHQHIIHTIIELAHNMGINVVAEGVEDIEQRDLLYKLDCDNIQGYYYSRPLPENEVEDFFKNKNYEK